MKSSSPGERQGESARSFDDQIARCEDGSIGHREGLSPAIRAPNHLNALRAFEAVARRLSYLNAAEELHITPAAIGQLARGLEDVLDVEVFHRAPSGPSRLILTDAARSIVPELQAGFDLLSTAVERLRASKARITFPVRVPPAFAAKDLSADVDEA